jgi:vancomycin permeability regulator SanA
LKPECIIVLGAGVNEDGSPSPALKARMNTGIHLYNQGVAPKLLLSGDNGQVEYDEVSAMKAYALEQGVPEEDIFMDHAGFSTYDSIYRANYIFCVSRALVVSQKDHLNRAQYGCKKVGIEAKGVPAEGYEKYSQYYGNEYNVREYLARAKDFVKWIIKPEPKYLGDKIPIDGDGRQTEGD